MFENFKDLANLPQMIAKMKAMQSKMADTQAELVGELGGLRITADAGNGAVVATCNGKLELVSLQINPTAEVADIEQLQRHIVSAVAIAQQKAQVKAAEVTQEKMAKAAEEAGITDDMMDQLRRGGLGGLGG
ncbi:MAG: YbaB/EbfC family nucleoid-associated protein [Planctomycetota bacterium]